MKVPADSPSLLLFFPPPSLVSELSLVSSWLWPCPAEAPAAAWSPFVLRLSVDAFTGWSLLLDAWLAGECIVERPRLKVLNRVTKLVLFLKLKSRMVKLKQFRVWITWFKLLLERNYRTDQLLF